MLSASFYVNDGELGFLELAELSDSSRHDEFDVKWTGVRESEDVQTQITRSSFDSVYDLFAMALVEVDAILAERAVN